MVHVHGQGRCWGSSLKVGKILLSFLPLLMLLLMLLLMPGGERERRRKREKRGDTGNRAARRLPKPPCILHFWPRRLPWLPGAGRSRQAGMHSRCYLVIRGSGCGLAWGLRALMDSLNGWLLLPYWQKTKPLRHPLPGVSVAQTCHAQAKQRRLAVSERRASGANAFCLPDACIPSYYPPPRPPPYATSKTPAMA